MVTNFNVSAKTKAPACCSFDCCGNKFGRISRRTHSSKQKTHHSFRVRGTNRIKLTRRYAKRAEKAIVRREIEQQIQEQFDILEKEYYIYDEIEYWEEWVEKKAYTEYSLWLMDSES